ncbi:MAG: hypothetical protein MJ168_08390 [Clostridia bacterium]|nr:hypothetical protein [Clostridia bacterium]
MTNYYNDYYFFIVIKAIQTYTKQYATDKIFKKYENQGNASDSILKEKINTVLKKIDYYFENMPDDKSIKLYRKVFPMLEKRRNEDYKKECYTFNAKKEYGEAYKGPKWIIFTDLSPVMLKIKYGSIIKKYQPYKIEEFRFAEAFKEYFRAEELYKKRLSEHRVMPFEEEITDRVFSELWIEEPFEQMCKKDNENLKRNVFISCWNELSEQQKKRIKSYKIDKKPIEIIAEEESVSTDAVYHTIKRGTVSFAKKLNKSKLFNIKVSKLTAEEVQM